MTAPYNGLPPSVAGSETSREAAASMVPYSWRIRDRVQRFIALQMQSGATCDDVEVFTGYSHQTASARIRELYLGGVIDYLRSEDGTLVKRKTRSGRNAQVYIAKERQP